MHFGIRNYCEICFVDANNSTLAISISIVASLLNSLEQTHPESQNYQYLRKKQVLHSFQQEDDASSYNQVHHVIQAAKYSRKVRELQGDSLKDQDTNIALVHRLLEALILSLSLDHDLWKRNQLSKHKNTNGKTII